MLNINSFIPFYPIDGLTLESEFDVCVIEYSELLMLVHTLLEFAQELPQFKWPVDICTKILTHVKGIQCENNDIFEIKKNANLSVDFGEVFVSCVIILSLMSAFWSLLFIL